MRVLLTFHEFVTLKSSFLTACPLQLRKTQLDFVESCMLKLNSRIHSDEVNGTLVRKMFSKYCIFMN